MSDPRPDRPDAADLHALPEADGPDDDATLVDARGLSCPMPVIELARAVEGVEVGGHVRLLATDPAAKVDVPVWCRMQRQKLHSREETDGVWRFLVERVR